MLESKELNILIGAGEKSTSDDILFFSYSSRFTSLAMKFQPSPESCLTFAKASVFLVCSWPPDSRATRAQNLRFRIQWWITLCLLSMLFLPLANGVWHFRHNPMMSVKTILMTSATAQALMKIIICRFQRKRFQVKNQNFDNDSYLP